VKPAAGRNDETVPQPPRRSRALALGTVAGVIMIVGWLPGEAVAAVGAARLASAAGPCAARPAVTAAAYSAVAGHRGPSLGSAAAALLTGQGAAQLSAASMSPASSTSASPSSSVSASPSSPSTASPTPTPSPAPSPSGPTPTKSPSPSKPPSPSKSPPSPHPSPRTATLCVAVQALSSGIAQGTTGSYAIWVWSTGAAARGVSVTTAALGVAGVGTPRFTVCPAAGGTACAVGDLPTGQADELLASVSVASSVAAGNDITLIASARGTSAVSAEAEASVVITAAPGSSLLPPALPAGGLPTLPGGLPTLPGTGTSSNLTNLFPTVTPGSSTTQTPGSPASGSRYSRAIKATTASATLPLDARLIGGQLAGLAVLACAIAAAIARLSLRSSRQSTKKAGR
jgi:hypothetical protein